mgnify:FL=1
MFLVEIGIVERRRRGEQRELTRGRKRRSIRCDAFFLRRLLSLESIALAEILVTKAFLFLLYPVYANLCSPAGGQPAEVSHADPHSPQ